MRDELYINGIKVDLGKTNIDLNYKSNLLSDISKIVSNNSYTIKLPKTAKNLALIECSHIPSAVSNVPYMKHAGTLIRDGIEIVKDANVVLLKTNESIEIALSWGNVINFANVVSGGKKLTDLSREMTQNIDWVVWNKRDKASLPFPKIDYGFNDGDPNVWYHPAVTVQYVINKIARENGVTFDIPSNKWEEINEMIIPLLTKNDSQEFYDKYPLSFTGDGVSRTQVFGLEIRDGKIGLNIKFNVDNTLSKYGDISTFKFKDQETTLATRGYAIYHDSVNTKIKGTVMASFAMPDPTDINRIRLEIRVSDSILHSITPASFQVTGDKQYSVGFNINNTVQNRQNDVLYFVLNTNGFTENPVIQNSNLKITLSPRGEVYFGEKFPFVPNLPDIKQIDFIKAITSMLGLFAIPGENSTIKFIPFDNLKENVSKSVDWTNKVAQAYKESVPRGMEYTLDNTAQNNRFLYKEDNSIKGNYDGNLKIEDSTIDFERDAIKLPFSACDTKNGVASIPMYSYNDKGELQYKKVNPRLLLMKLENVNESSGNVLGVFKGLEWETLLKNNYGTYKGMVNEAKVITEHVHLSSIELRDLEMDIPVYLGQYGCYLAIIEIKTKENDICECKLLKLEV